MIGLDEQWAAKMQAHGRSEMQRLLRDAGAAAATDYAARFERETNEWLAWNGYEAVFVFQPTALPQRGSSDA